MSLFVGAMRELPEEKHRSSLSPTSSNAVHVSRLIQPTRAPSTAPANSNTSSVSTRRERGLGPGPRQGLGVRLCAREWAPIALDASARYVPLEVERESPVPQSELGSFERPLTQLNFSYAARRACGRECRTSCYVLTGAVP